MNNNLLSDYKISANYLGQLRVTDQYAGSQE